MLRCFLIVAGALLFTACSSLAKHDQPIVQAPETEAEQALTLARTLRDAGRFQAAVSVY